MRRAAVAVLVGVALGGCPDDGGSSSSADSGPGSDSGSGTDTGAGPDTGGTDAGGGADTGPGGGDSVSDSGGGPDGTVEDTGGTPGPDAVADAGGGDTGGPDTGTGDAGADTGGADADDAGDGGLPEGAWGKEGEPLPDEAELLTPEEIDALEAAGELIPVTKQSLIDAAEAAAARRAEDEKVVADYVKDHPELAERFYAQPSNPNVVPTADGNWAVPITLADGSTQTIVTHGDAARFAAIAKSIKAAQSVENQKEIFLTVLPLTSEACQLGAPQAADLDTMDAASIRAARKALVACWKAETMPDEDPPPEEFEEPWEPEEPPPSPEGWVGDQTLYEGGAPDPTDGSQTTCTPAQSPYVNWSGRYYLTPVKNQANRGSCASFGTVSAIETHIAHSKNKWVNLSEQALYAKAKLDWFEEDFEDGLPTSDLLEEIHETGWHIPYEVSWSYNPSWSRVEHDDYWTGSCTGYTGPACSNKVHQAKHVCENLGGNSYCYYWRPKSPGNSGYTIGKVVELEDFEGDELDTAKIYLSAGYGVVIAADVTDAWMSPPANGYFTNNDETDEIGGHAMHVVRYLPNSQLPSGKSGKGGGRVMIKNSWGCWADGGFVYVPAEWVNDQVHSLMAITGKKVGTDQAPSIEILEPIPNKHFSYGGFFNEHTFSAVASDLEDGDDCCSLSWSSSKDGPLGTGKSVKAYFGTPGPRVITVTATDSNGGKSQKSITVYADNFAPEATITQPSSGAPAFYKGAPVSFQGEATDKNEPAGLPCSSFTWTSSVPGDPMPQIGCGITAVFPTNGQRTITLTVMDAKGATGKATRNVNVTDPPPNKPPIVAIVSPATDDAYLDAGVVTNLQATATDPDGESMTYKWTIQTGASEKEIGTSLFLQWKPSNDVPFNCGGSLGTLRFYATDKDGTSKAQRSVYIAYPPC